MTLSAGSVCHDFGVRTMWSPPVYLHFFCVMHSLLLHHTKNTQSCVPIHIKPNHVVQQQPMLSCHACAGCFKSWPVPSARWMCACSPSRVTRSQMRCCRHTSGVCACA